MHFLDKPGLTGVLSITKITSEGESSVFTGTIPHPFPGLNLIVNSAKQRLLSMVWNPVVVADPVTHLRIGVGGTSDPQGLYVQQESVTQTSLNSPIPSLSNVSVAYSVSSDGLSVTFNATIDQSTGNGYVLSEAGLFTTSGAMFNVKNHPGIQKTADFSLQYSWTIKLS